MDLERHGRARERRAVRRGRVRGRRMVALRGAHGARHGEETPRRATFRAVGVLDVVLGGSKRARRVAKVRQNTREERVARVRDVRAPRGVARGTVRKRRAAFEVDDERLNQKPNGVDGDGDALRGVRRRRRVERDSPQLFRAGEGFAPARAQSRSITARARVRRESSRGSRGTGIRDRVGDPRVVVVGDRGRGRGDDLHLVILRRQVSHLLTRHESPGVESRLEEERLEETPPARRDGVGGFLHQPRREQIGDARLRQHARRRRQQLGHPHQTPIAIRLPGGVRPAPRGTRVSRWTLHERAPQTTTRVRRGRELAARHREERRVHERVQRRRVSLRRGRGRRRVTTSPRLGLEPLQGGEEMVEEVDVAVESANPLASSRRRPRRLDGDRVPFSFLSNHTPPLRAFALAVEVRDERARV